MNETVADRNWDITYLGALSVIGIAAGFLTYLASTIQIQRPLVLAAGAGIAFAVASKAGSMDRFQAILKPLSGFLDMVAGTLLLVSVLLFFASSLEIIRAAMERVGDGSVLAMIQAVVLPVMGYSTVLFGVFIAATGSSLVVWDRVDERLPVGAGRRDFLFTGILAALTVSGIFGTAFLRDLPIGTFLDEAVGLATRPSSFSSLLGGVLLVVAYHAGRRAWRVLPVRELVPRSSRDAYDRLAGVEAVVAKVVVPLLGLALLVHQFAAVPFVGAVAAVVGSSMARMVLVGVLVLSIGSYVVVKLLKLLTGGREKIERILPYVLFGVLAYLIASLLTGTVDRILVGLPEELFGLVQPVLLAVGQRHFIMVVMTVASASAVSLGLFAGLLRGVGLMPRGIEGTTMVAVGLFVSAVGFNLYSPEPVVLFAGVALSMVAWELGKRSVLLGRAVGRSGSTYQAELIQLAFKLGMAFVAVVIARTVLVAVDNTVISLPSGTTGFVVFLLAITGVGLVTASLKDLT